MKSRMEFVRLAQQGGNMRQLCQRFGISPSTGYKWLGRWRRGEALSDRSRRPEHSPRRSDAGIEQAVLAARHAHPAWGARKLARWLMDRGQQAPAPSTVHAILVRHGCISAQASEAATAWLRFEHSAPNELWQMDFKGHFALSDRRCHPLTILDDHSRYSLCLGTCADEQGATVRERLIATFRRYGLPRRMSMDNGAPWGDAGGTHYTRLDVWLMKQGIVVGHSRPWHPQTQGKDERFHRTLKAELLQGRCWSDLSVVQRAFDDWRSLYNHERPHQALAMATPASRYRASPLEYCEHPGEPDYADPAQVRRVQDGRVSGILWARHNMRENHHGYARETQETIHRGPGGRTRSPAPEAA